jgi:threonine aldolase
MIIDLRSDTVTMPSIEMKEAMFSAKVGDDVFQDDESVNDLEMLSAKMFGKEAAIFCPSGTMTNQIGIKLHANAPGELICDELSHVYQYEGGGIGFHSGLATKLIPGINGKITADQINAAINPDDLHLPESQLVSLENTCNKGGGTYYELDELKKIRSLCTEKELKLHLDGARIFNAIVEAKYSATEIGAQFDTISICLSKGLGAPIGSLLLGKRKTIKKARKLRKIFGGGMRQVGYVAAAGTYALKNNISRLADDHHRAKILEETLIKLPFVKEVKPVITNIIIVEIVAHIDAKLILQKLSEKSIHAISFGPQKIRFVTHLDFTNEMLEQTITVLNSLK